VKLAGYLINTRMGLQGERGLIYDYILAGNGLFLEARTSLLEARICLAPVAVRGLAPLEESLSLPQGRIPGYLYELALSVIYTDIYRECYLAVTWDGRYHLKMPAQERQRTGVDYRVLESTILDIHSHPGMTASSSLTDDRDEQGFRLSLVIGRLYALTPEVSLRLGVYGYYRELALEDVFECIP